jgi:hypothetical protein
MSSRELTPEYLASQDLVLIVTDHSAYNWPWIVEHSPLIVDTRNATKAAGGTGGLSTSVFNPYHPTSNSLDYFPYPARRTFIACVRGLLLRLAMITTRGKLDRNGGRIT